MITVLVADDHAVVREGLSLLLSGAEDVRVVALATDGEQAVAMTAQHQPAVVLMDLSMPVMDGIDATRIISEQHPDTAVVVLTTFADNRRVMACLEAGAVGYLMKDSTPAEIVAGVRAAASGGSPLDPRVARSIIDAQRTAVAGACNPPAGSPDAQTDFFDARGGSRALGPLAGQDGSPPAGASAKALTAKQTEVLTLVSRGMSNRLIARTLGISEKTVKAHLTTIYTALGVTDRVQAALWAQRHLRPPPILIGRAPLGPGRGSTRAASACRDQGPGVSRSLTWPSRPARTRRTLVLANPARERADRDRVASSARRPATLSTSAPRSTPRADRRL